MVRESRAFGIDDRIPCVAGQFGRTTNPGRPSVRYPIEMVAVVSSETGRPTTRPRSARRRQRVAERSEPATRTAPSGPTTTTIRVEPQARQRATPLGEKSLDLVGVERGQVVHLAVAGAAVARPGIAHHALPAGVAAAHQPQRRQHRQRAPRRRLLERAPHLVERTHEGLSLGVRDLSVHDLQCGEPREDPLALLPERVPSIAVRHPDQRQRPAGEVPR